MRNTVLKRAYYLAEVVGAPADRLALLEEHTGEAWTPPRLDADTVSSLVDHTILSFDATKEVIDRLCAEAAEYGFAAVCVNPAWVARAKASRERLNGRFCIASVVDFPLGASTFVARRAEAASAVEAGADELDLVIGIGLLKSQCYAEVYEGIRCVAEKGAFLKVILETSVLTPEEKIDAAILAVFGGAHMLKTSTGVNGKATPDDVAFLRFIVGKALGVKAAGGIRDRATLEQMVAAGADRIGSSSSCVIVKQWM